MNTIEKSKVIDSNKFQQITIEILKDFDDVCRENNLRYSIAFGTLLGAVRHKGYIPWDDDIDVIMPRMDYIKFLSVAHEMKENHKLISIETEKDFMSPLAKIIDTNTVLHQKEHVAERIDLGVYIDVFVLDYIPESKKKTNRVYKVCNILQKGWSFCENGPSAQCSPILRMLRRCANRTKLARVFSILLNSYAKKIRVCNGMLSNLLFGYSDRSYYVMPENVFDQLEEYDFEKIKVLGLKDYDKYLTRWYGDYMELPPVESRVLHHSYEVYFRE